MADNLSRDVLLRIRAQNLATADFNAARNAVDTLTASLDKQIQAANRAEISEKELSATLTKLQQATQNFTGVATMIDQFKSFDKVLADQAARVTKAGETLEQYRLKLEQSKDTSAGAERQLERLAATFEKQQAKLRENTQTFQEMGAALQKAGVDTNQLVEAENRLRQAADQAGAAITKISDAKLNLAENTRKAKQEAAELAAAEKAAAEEAKKAATIHAAAIREQEAEQLKAFQAFTSQEKALAEGRARALRDVQAGVAGYRQEQQQRQQAAREAVERQLAEERRLTEQLKQQQAQRARDADRAARDQFEAFRQSILNRNRATAQGAGIGGGATPVPGTAPVVPGMPRTDALGRPGRGASAQPGLLGLRPYELTNLGYQVNDVITGLASGQNALQVFAQQGGQFFQIFGLAALKWLPVVGTALAAVGVAVKTLTTSFQQAQTIRDFTAALTVNANAVGYSVQALADLTNKLEDLGVARKDAIAIFNQEIKGGIRPELVESFAVLARNISRVTGTDIKEAMSDLITGLTGGTKAFEELLAKYPAIDEARRKEIVQLFESGQAHKAQIAALRELIAAYDKANKEATGPLEQATIKLNTAWNELFRTLAKSQVFIDLVTRLTELVTATKDAVKYVDELAKKMDDPKFQTALKVMRFLTDPTAIKNLFPDFSQYGTPGQPGGGPAAPPGQTAPIPPEGGGTGAVRVRTGIQPFDTTELQQLLAVLKEASKSLPEGYSARVSSTERPGAVTYKGTPSEHGAGRAIDVHVVDAQGKDVPGAMFAGGGPLYNTLDKAFGEAAKRLYPSQAFAIGGTFGERPDYGHYSTGGREAALNAARRGVPDADGTQQRQSERQTADNEQRLRQLEDERKLRRANAEATELQLIKEKALKDAQEAGANATQQQQLVKEAADKFLDERRRVNYEHEQQDNKDRISDRNNAQRIEAAGQKAVEDALAHQITNYKELYDIRKKGEAEERARVSNETKEADELLTIRKQLASLTRGNQLKDATELEKALDGVKNQYLGIRAEIDKLEKRSTTVPKEQIDKLRSDVDAAQKVAERQATVGSYEAQAKEALRTRNELVQSYANQQARGDITISEQQKLTKDAFDLTAPAIKKAADEMEAYLKTSEGLAQPPLKIAEQTAKIKELRSELKYIDPFMKGLRDTISTSLGTGLSTAFNTIGEAIGGVIAKTKTWKDVLTAVRQAGINLFTQLLKDIANYIIKAEAAKLASSLFGVTTAGDAATGAAGSGVFGFLGKVLGISSSGAAGATGAAAAAGGTSAAGSAEAVLLLHRGGVVGHSTVPAMSVPSYWFANAPRYHRGSVIGMGPNEQAAILQHGEEVLTRDDPRNILNRARGGVGGSRDVNIRSILVADPSYVPTAMAGAQGEKIVVQHLVKNAATVRQLLKN